MDNIEEQIRDLKEELSKLEYHFDNIIMDNIPVTDADTKKTWVEIKLLKEKIQNLYMERALIALKEITSVPSPFNPDMYSGVLNKVRQQRIVEGMQAKKCQACIIEAMNRANFQATSYNGHTCIKGQLISNAERQRYDREKNDPSKVFQLDPNAQVQAASKQFVEKDNHTTVFGYHTTMIPDSWYIRLYNKIVYGIKWVLSLRIVAGVDK